MKGFCIGMGQPLSVFWLCSMVEWNLHSEVFDGFSAQLAIVPMRTATFSHKLLLTGVNKTSRTNFLLWRFHLLLAVTKSSILQGAKCPQQAGVDTTQLSTSQDKAPSVCVHLAESPEQIVRFGWF